jgi:hypothetical protein
MNAMNTLLKTVLLVLLVALSVEQASGQIVDPNPPIVCESDDGGDDGSYIEISGKWQSPEAEVNGRLEWEDVKEWIDTLFGALFGGGGNGGGGETPPDGGENPPGEGETPPDGGENPPGEGETPPGEGENPPGEGETPPGEGENPPGEGETPPGGDENGGNAEESSGAPDCSTVLQQLRYAKVEVARSHLVVTMARSSALDIVEVHLTRPVAIPPRMKQRAGLRGNWFIKPGTYTTTRQTIRLPLVERKR